MNRDTTFADTGTPRSRAESAIDASPEQVWRLLTDVAQWPRWNPAVRWVRAKTPLAIGSVFAWKSQGVTVTSTVTELRPASRLVWTGRALGTRAVHVWEIVPAGGGVVVHTSEIFDGWLPRLFPQTMQRKLEATLPSWLAVLRARAEVDRRR